MAENIVSLTKTVNNLALVVAAIAEHVGLTSTSSGENAAPKTSAKVTSREGSSSTHMSRKGQTHQDVTITLTEAMIDGRMKFPARMFTKGGKVMVDGHTFTQQPQDQNRSTKFDPAIFGDVSVGDAITFEFVSGREWTVAGITSGGRKSKGRQKSAKPAAKPTKSNKPNKPSGGSTKSGDSRKVARSESGTSSIKAELRKFADMCIENASDDDFEENENIKATGSMGDADDARVYLTTAQNQKFRSWRKRNGLTLRKAVGMLNELVFED